SFTHGNTSLGHVKEGFAIVVLIRFIVLPAALRASFPGPPVLAVCIAVECALAGDSNVLLRKGVDERRVVHQFDAFPARKYHRIFPRVADEAHRGAAKDMKIHITFEVDSTSTELAYRNNHASATSSRAGRDCLFESFSAVERSIASGAKLCD